MATPVSNAFRQHDESSALCYLAGLLIPKIKGAFLSNRQINRKNRSGVLCPMLSSTPLPTVRRYRGFREIVSVRARSGVCGSSDRLRRVHRRGEAAVL
jgi:hypothetical protein